MLKIVGQVKIVIGAEAWDVTVIDSSTSSSGEKLEELSARLTLRTGELILGLGDGAAMLEGGTPGALTR